MNNQFKIWPVLRDVIVVTLLSCLGGFIVGFASTSGHNSPRYIYSLALSNGLFLTIGFTISGCLAIGNRWRHLAIVAAIVWAVSIFNVIFFEFTIIKWLATAIVVAIFALIGGGISLLFKRKSLVEISPNAGMINFMKKSRVSCRKNHWLLDSGQRLLRKWEVMMPKPARYTLNTVSHNWQKLIATNLKTIDLQSNDRKNKKMLQ